jgi:hypothetical protein
MGICIVLAVFFLSQVLYCMFPVSARQSSPWCLSSVSWRRAGMAGVGVSTHDETNQSSTLSRLSAEPHIQAPESGSLVSLVNLVAILPSCHVVVRRGARSCLFASVAPSDWPDAETRCCCQRTTTNPRLTDCDFQNRLVPLSLSTRAPTLHSQCRPPPRLHVKLRLGRVMLLQNHSIAPPTMLVLFLCLDRVCWLPNVNVS